MVAIGVQSGKSVPRNWNAATKFMTSVIVVLVVLSTGAYSFHYFKVLRSNGRTDCENAVAGGAPIYCSHADISQIGRTNASIDLFSAGFQRCCRIDRESSSRGSPMCSYDAEVSVVDHYNASVDNFSVRFVCANHLVAAIHTCSNLLLGWARGINLNINVFPTLLAEAHPEMLHHSPWTGRPEFANTFSRDARYLGPSVPPAQNTGDQIVPDIDEAADFHNPLLLDDPVMLEDGSHDLQSQEDGDHVVPENPPEGRNPDLPVQGAYFVEEQEFQVVPPDGELSHQLIPMAHTFEAADGHFHNFRNSLQTAVAVPLWVPPLHPHFPAEDQREREQLEQFREQSQILEQIQHTFFQQ